MVREYFQICTGCFSVGSFVRSFGRSHLLEFCFFFYLFPSLYTYCCWFLVLHLLIRRGAAPQSPSPSNCSANVYKFNATLYYFNVGLKISKYLDVIQSMHAYIHTYGDELVWFGLDSLHPLRLQAQWSIQVAAK